MIVNLITYRNRKFKSAFERRGFEVAEFSPLMEPQYLKSGLRLKSANYTLLELPAEEGVGNPRLDETVKLLYGSTKLICLCEKITPFIRGLLLEQGIADCIGHFDVERIVSYVEMLHKSPSQKPGSFLVLDDSTANRNMLNGIIKRFGYGTEFVTGADSLFAALNNSNIIMILMNLGTADLDLNSIVRRAYGSSEIKRFPVVAYKCLEQGLFVHEVLTGLNRLTRAIYSPEELFCMLVDILFKKEIMSITSEFCSALDYEKFRNCSGATIPQIYNDVKNDPFSSENIFSGERINAMTAAAGRLTASLVKIDGLRWLRLNQSRETRPTCGAGA